MKKILLLNLCLISIAIFNSGCRSDQAAVVGAYKKLGQVDSYYNIADTKKGMQITEFYYSKPDGYWVSIKGRNDNDESQQMVIGDKAYEKIVNSWVPDPKTEEVRKFIANYDLAKMDMAKLHDVKFVENTKLNGKDAAVYTYRLAGQREYYGKIWVALDTGLPLRIDEGAAEPGDLVSIVFDHSKKIDLKSFIPK